MITAKKAHELSTKQREVAEAQSLIAALERIEREVMKAIAAGHYSVSMLPDEHGLNVIGLQDALESAGYSVRYVEKRGKHPWTITVAWGAPREVKP